MWFRSLSLILCVLIGGLIHAAALPRQHRSGRITGLEMVPEDDLESLIESIESVVSNTVTSAVADHIADQIEDRAAGWWSWIWRAIKRTGPPPIDVDIPIADPCEGFYDCAWELAAHMWDLMPFVVSQLRILLVDPAAWSRQIHDKFDEQLSQLRAVEHVLFGAVIWILVVNVFIASGFALLYFQDHQRRLQAWIDWVPLLRLSRVAWRWLTNQRRQNSVDNKLDALTASVCALQAQLAQAANHTESESGLAAAVNPQLTGPSRLRNRGLICWWCGGQNHLQRNCPVRPKAPSSPCRRCGGRHWSDQCPQLEQASAVNGEAWAGQRRCLYRVAGQVADGQRRSTVKFLVDTGSSVNLLPTSVCEEIGAVVRPSPTTTVHSFAGDSHSVMGQVALQTTIGDAKQDLVYLVLANAPSVILAMQGLQEFGMTIDCQNDSLTTQQGSRVFCHRVSGGKNQKTSSAGSPGLAKEIPGGTNNSGFFSSRAANTHCHPEA